MKPIRLDLSSVTRVSWIAGLSTKRTATARTCPSILSRVERRGATGRYSVSHSVDRFDDSPCSRTEWGQYQSDDDRDVDSSADPGVVPPEHAQRQRQQR